MFPVQIEVQKQAVEFVYSLKNKDKLCFTQTLRYSFELVCNVCGLKNEREECLKMDYNSQILSFLQTD